MRGMKLKLSILGLLFLGWRIASGTISVKIQVANGPSRPVGHDLISDAMLKIEGGAPRNALHACNSCNSFSSWC